MLVPHTPKKTLTYQNVTYTLYQLFKITEIVNFSHEPNIANSYLLLIVEFYKDRGSSEKNVQIIKTDGRKDL